MLIKTNGPYMIKVNENVELLVIAQYHIPDDQVTRWGIEGEEKALSAHNGVIGFIEKCLKWKIELFKWFKEKDAKPSATENASS
jgi:hypothetical protein